MVDVEKLKNRLEDEFERVKVIAVGADKSPVFFACNYYDRNFMLVSVFMDMEIGGWFKLEPNFVMNHVYENFDVVQAEELRNGMIAEIENDNVEVVGNVDPRKLH